MGRGGFVGVVCALVLALAPAGATGQFLGGQGSTGLKTCDRSGCKQQTLLPIGLQTAFPLGERGIADVVCVARTELPVNGIGKVVVCDPPPDAPFFTMDLVRVEAVGHKAAVTDTSGASSISSSRELGIELDGRGAYLVTECDYALDPEPGSFCVP